MPTELVFSSPPSPCETPALVVIGRRERLAWERLAEHLPADLEAVWEEMLDAVKAGDFGDGTTTFRGSGREGPTRVAVGILPEACSRHNSPARPHAVADLTRKLVPSKGDVTLLLALDDPAHAFAAGCAAARAFSRFTRKSNGDPQAQDPRTVRVSLIGPEGAVDEGRLAAVSEGIRLAAELVDMPTSELHTDAFAAIAKDRAEALGAAVEIIEGEALIEGGFGGLWGVGKAATRGPKLVILKHRPEGASRKIVWVGKGIVYDTGGLSIKGKTNMPGMKGDMGGAAATLGGFLAAVELGVRYELTALLCLAENSVGPESTRPDDILTLKSGKTVEINNTDAEGRLVLGDGVAYAVETLEPDVIVDLATLTGAQLISTGKRHAAIVCNDEALEAAAVAAGKRCGDLVHPLPFAPEFFRAEFKSKVADLKNSVKDRMNAQSACAAQFVAEHLGAYLDDGKWLHVDLAGPSEGPKERGSGYGVALLVELFGQTGEPSK